MSYEIINSDCLKAMQEMPDGCVDAIVTDPPYGLSFMGEEWDSFGTDTRQPGDEHYWVPDNPYGRAGVRYGWNQDKSKLAKSNRAFQERMTPIFEEALRVAKPGAHLLCFGGTRTFHRIACAIEDAGWEIRDTIMWVYGSGFPKSMDVSKAIDKALDAERPIVGHSDHGSGPWHGKLANHRKGDTGIGIFDGSGKSFDITGPASDQAKQWEGWGTCLKPAWEPIIVARKPLDGTVAHNVMTYGTGAINIDGCRVGTETMVNRPAGNKAGGNSLNMSKYGMPQGAEPTTATGRFPANLAHDGSQEVLELFPNESGRFFYCAKASKKDRGEGNDHPTVKPNALMRWLVRLVCPQGGTVLDPFMGSGSTGVACMQEGMEFVGIDMDQHYCEIAERRIAEEPLTVFDEVNE